MRLNILGAAAVGNVPEVPPHKTDSNTSDFERLLDLITEDSDSPSRDRRAPTAPCNEREYIYAPGHLALPLFYGNGSLFFVSSSVLVENKEGG